MKKSKIVAGLLLIVFGLIMLSGCANKEDIEPCLTGIKYNFWGGLWHGIIAPIDFIGMLFIRM
jgi:sulfite exporter TauE/SafE